MKTWEMIKELTENPNKKFANKGGLKNCYVTVEDGIIVWRGDMQCGQAMSIGFIDGRDREWEEVKEPVTFMEAVESGKRIRVEHKLVNDSDIWNLIDLTSLDCLIYTLGEKYNAIEVKDIIENGKWYIED